MIRFLGIVVFLTVVSGATLHMDVELPWYLDWLGNLPGDAILKKGETTIYLPFTSSLVAASICSLFLFSKK